MFNRKLAITALIIGAVLVASPPAWADGDPDAVAKAKAAVMAAQKEDSILRLTPDKDFIIRLDQNAASVVVNNPQHVSVVLDNPRLLIVMPRQPGTTSFSVLNAQGETILQKTVIVSGTQKNYVRVRRICASNDASCNSAGYYYCPDGCYEVTPVPAGTSNAPPPPPQGGNAPRASLPPALSTSSPASSNEAGSSESAPSEAQPANEAVPPPETGNFPIGPNGEPDTSGNVTP